jgi:hypothetical protein
MTAVVVYDRNQYLFVQKSLSLREMLWMKQNTMLEQQRQWVRTIATFPKVIPIQVKELLVSGANYWCSLRESTHG